MVFLRLSSPGRVQSAFSLIELLAVVSIMSCLMVLSGLIFRGISGGARVDTAGNRVAEVIDAARQNSLLKKRPTAFVLLVSGDDSAHRFFTVLEYQPPGVPGAGTWRQIFRWDSLPAGVVVDGKVDANGVPATSFLPPQSPAISPLGPVIFQGKSYEPNASPGYAYFIFSEDGSVMKDSSGNPPVPLKVRLVEGVVGSTGQVQYTSAQRADGAGPSNYYEIVVNEATGRTKILRP